MNEPPDSKSKAQRDTQVLVGKPASGRSNPLEAVMTALYLCARQSDVELYYTGRAGEGWVSPDASEAFTFNSWEHASGRAAAFNKYQPVHGLTFEVRGSL